MFNEIDSDVLQFMGHYAHKSEVFDRFVMNVLARASFSMLPIVLCLWAVWFSKKNPEKAKLSVFISMTSGFFSLVLSRVVQNFGPERLRPIHSGNPDYVAPYGVDTAIMKDWSSFPSDHAALALALSSGIIMFSRPLGIFCYAWSLFAICMPRVYGGYHYATDILFGALVGIVSFMILLYWRTFSVRALPLADRFEHSYPGPFYALAFFISFQLATMFEDIRSPLEALMKCLHLH